MFSNRIVLAQLSIVLFLGVFGPTMTMLSAHCDTFAGPVLIEAQQALEGGEVRALLKWVPPERKEQIKRAFAKALRQRTTDRQKADSAFFETFVRIHREGEGAAFTGIKPADTRLPPAITAADRAVETGSAAALFDLLSRNLTQSVQAKFARVIARSKTKNKSVAAGREYVAAYVEYVHYVEAVSNLLNADDQHHRLTETKRTGQETCAPCSGHGK